jgi:hypothetical protein
LGIAGRGKLLSEIGKIPLNEELRYEQGEATEHEVIMALNSGRFRVGSDTHSAGSIVIIPSGSPLAPWTRYTDLLNSLPFIDCLGELSSNTFPFLSNWLETYYIDQSLGPPPKAATIHTVCIQLLNLPAGEWVANWAEHLVKISPDLRYLSLNCSIDPCPSILLNLPTILGKVEEVANDTSEILDAAKKIVQSTGSDGEILTQLNQLSGLPEGLESWDAKFLSLQANVSSTVKSLEFSVSETLSSELAKTNQAVAQASKIARFGLITGGVMAVGLGLWGGYTLCHRLSRKVNPS